MQNHDARDLHIPKLWGGPNHVINGLLFIKVTCVAHLLPTRRKGHVGPPCRSLHFSLNYCSNELDSGHWHPTMFVQLGSHWYGLSPKIEVTGENKSVLKGPKKSFKWSFFGTQPRGLGPGEIQHTFTRKEGPFKCEESPYKWKERPCKQKNVMYRGFEFWHLDENNHSLPLM